MNPPAADCKYRIMNIEVRYSACRELLCRTVYFKRLSAAIPQFVNRHSSFVIPCRSRSCHIRESGQPAVQTTYHDFSNPCMKLDGMTNVEPQNVKNPPGPLYKRGSTRWVRSPRRRLTTPTSRRLRSVFLK